MRVDKFFSDIGMFTRKEINSVIKNKRVKVNEKLIIKSSTIINEKQDIVMLDDEIVQYQKEIYCIFNKPSGYITATEDKKEKTIYEFLPEYFLRKNIIPIGRLDKDTTGLLILTNDGEFCHKLTSPKHEVEKEYTFCLADEIQKSDIEKLENGKIVLKDGQKIKPCKINMIDSRTGNIIITEGKYHQIKRMFGAVGNKIIQLKRIREGKLILPQSLREGEFMIVNKEDIYEG